MYKKNTAITGFTFGLVSKTDGSAIITGTVTVKELSKDGVQSTVAATPTHLGDGQYSVNLTNTEMNADHIGLVFATAASVPVHFTIKTDTSLASDVETKVDTAITDIAENQTDLNTVIANLATVDTVVDRIEVDTISIETKVDTVDTVVDRIEVDTTSIETKVDTVDTVVDSIQIDTNSIETKIDSLDTVVDRIEVDTISIETKVDTIDGIVDNILLDTVDIQKVLLNKIVVAADDLSAVIYDDNSISTLYSIVYSADGRTRNKAT